MTQTLEMILAILLIIILFSVSPWQYWAVIILIGTGIREVTVIIQKLSEVKSGCNKRSDQKDD